MLMERWGSDAGPALHALRQVAARDGSTVAAVAARLLTTRRLDGDAPLTVTDGLPVEVATRQAPGGLHDERVARLSERELQVVTLIARGATNEEIGQQLFIGVNTVKTYIRTAYRKIGVTRRPQAVIWAHHVGLVSPDDAPSCVTPPTPTRRS